MERNYGVLTDVSKVGNEILGDTSGRSISMRTAHGMKRMFNQHLMSDNDAEDLTHAIMATTGFLLASKKENLKVAGVFLLFGILAMYFNGK